MLAFAPLSPEDCERYTRFYSLCPEKCAQYSFFSLWGWNETEPVELAFSDSLCWIRCCGYRKGLRAPIGDWSAVDWETELTECFGSGDFMLDVPEAMICAMPVSMRQRLDCEELRDEWEYVHSVAELSALAGGKYAAKRAHVKAFMDNYYWDYSPILPEDFPELLEFQADWCRRRDCSSNFALAAENNAIRRALEMWNDLPLFGALLRVDGTVVAYTIGEEFSADTLGIRFEKAESGYTGIYQALNNLFLKRQCQTYSWVNREEDMGNPGLRDAKLSYHPVRFVKKFKMSLKTRDGGDAVTEAVQCGSTL